MRYFEIASGLKLPVSSEEAALLRLLAKEPVKADSFNERQRELARLMRSRGAVDCFKHDGQIYYKASSANDIWREPDDC
jgi:hypothetical protein